MSSSAAGRQGRRRIAVSTACAAVAVAAGWGVPTPVAVGSLNTLQFDPPPPGGISVGNVSGLWNTTTTDWMASGGDVAWPNDGVTDAAIGSSLGAGSATVTLGANILAEGLTFNGLALGTSAYTFNANGFTYNASATTTDGLDVRGTGVTLTNGTFILGQLSSLTNQANLGVAGVLGGGSLTLAAGATLAASDIAGDGAFGDTVRFDGGTFRPLADVNVAVAPNGGFSYFPQLTGFTNAYVAAGGLTVDTSQVAGPAGTRSFAVFSQNVQHDPALVNTPDGGITVTGGGVLNLGYNETGSNPTFSYTGPTTVAAGVLILDSNANAAAAGPFPNTRFVIPAGGEVNVQVTNGLAGATGTTPVTITGGTLATFDGVSVHLADVTMTGGYLVSFPGPTSSTGTFTFGSGAELHALAAVTATAATPTVARVRSAFVTFESGSDVRVDGNAALAVWANVVDDAAGPGQLTVDGAGIVVLYGTNNAYTGATTVNGGELHVGYNASGSTAAVPARLTATGTIAVAAGATFLDEGVVASAPAVTANGLVEFATYPAAAAESTTLGSLTVGGSAAGTASTNGRVVLVASTATAPREAVVAGSLAFAGTTGAWFGRLDLGNNDLDVQNGNLAQVTNQVATAYAGGSFAGNGIYSSVAAADSNRLTTVGVAVNNDGAGNRLFGSGTTAGLFDGTDPAAADVLVRYTYYGDANLDGKVDGQDYARIDAGFLANGALTGWYNGDFNYDGKVDGSDYTLIDNAFNLQTAPLSASLVAAGADEIAVTGSAAVPEPTAVALLAIGVAATARRRPRA